MFIANFKMYRINIIHNTKICTYVIAIVITFNLLRWNDVSRTSRIFFFQNCNISSVSSITQAKQIINLLLLNNFYPVVSYRRVQKKSDETVVYGLVTRYGPQSVARGKWLIPRLIFHENCKYVFVSVINNYNIFYKSSIFIYKDLRKKGLSLEIFH